jgi:hypothetical protein
MRVKVVKATFYTDLWDAAQAAYTEKLQREANIAREAYILAEADMAVTLSRPPTDHHVYQYWIAGLGSLTQRVAQLKDEADAASNRASVCFGNRDWYRFKMQYEREHYKPPTEEDYEEVEAFSIYDPITPDAAEVSHATPVADA